GAGRGGGGRASAPRSRPPGPRSSGTRARRHHDACLPLERARRTTNAPCVLASRPGLGSRRAPARHRHRYGCAVLTGSALTISALRVVKANVVTARGPHGFEGVKMSWGAELAPPDRNTMKPPD